MPDSGIGAARRRGLPEIWVIGVYLCDVPLCNFYTHTPVALMWVRGWYGRPAVAHIKQGVRRTPLLRNP